jgi:hypothetical protein
MFLKKMSDTISVNRIISNIGNIVIDPADYSEVVLSRHPISNYGIATKGYVDSRTSGLETVKPCRVYANNLMEYSIHPLTFLITGNTNERLIIDEVLVEIGDRILFASNIDARIEYGIYVVLNTGSDTEKWILQRSDDTNETTEMVLGMYVLINEGTKYSNCGFTLITKGLITINETPLQFVIFSSPGKYYFMDADNAENSLISGVDGNFVYHKGLKSGRGVTIVGTHDNNIINVNESTINHSMLNIGNSDDHLNYFHIPGRIGGQTVYGGQNPCDNLIINSTSSINKGFVEIDNLRVSGNVEFSNRFQIDKMIANCLTINGNGEINGNCTVRNNILISGNSSFTGELNNFTGDIRSSGIIVGNKALFSSSLDSTSNSSGAVVITGGLGVAKTIYSNSLNCESITITGNVDDSLHLTGGITSNGKIITKEILLSGQIASNSLGTGTIVLAGDNAGLSVNGNINLGGNIIARNDISCNNLFLNTIASTTNLTIIPHVLMTSINVNSMSIDNCINIGDTIINSSGITSVNYTITGNVVIPNLRTNFVSVDSITTENLSINTSLTNFTGKILSTNTNLDSISTIGGIVATKEIKSIQQITTPIIRGINDLLITSKIINVNAELLDVLCSSNFANGVTISNGLMSVGASLLGLITITGNGITCTGNMNIYPSGILQINASSSIFSGPISASSIITDTCTIDNIFLRNVSGNSIRFIGENLVNFESPINLINTTNSINSTSGALIVSGGIGVAKNVFIGGNCTIVGDLMVDDVSCDAIFANEINCNVISNSIGVVINKLSISSSSESNNILTGALTISGGVGIAGNLCLKELTFINDTINSSTGIISTNANYICNDVVCAKITTSSINTGEISSNNIESASGIIEIISINEINSNMLAINAPVEIKNTSSSNSHTTGALTITGGVGISGELYVGNNINANTINVNRINPSDELTIIGDTNVAGRILCNDVSTNVINANVLNSTLNQIDIISNILTAKCVSVTELTVSDRFVMNGSMIVSGTGIFADEISCSDISITNATVNNIIAQNDTINMSSPLVCHSGITATTIVANTITTLGTITCETINANKFTGMDGVLIENTHAGAEIILSSTSHNSKGCVRIIDTTNSSSINTGALIVAGGVGINGNVNVGGVVSVSTINMDGVCVSVNTGIPIHAHNGHTYHHGSSSLNVRLKTTSSFNNSTSDGNTITFTTPIIIDGIEPRIGDLILIDCGINNRHYGVYKVTNSLLYTRFDGCNENVKMIRGMIIIITDGVEYGGSVWIHTTKALTGDTYTFSDILTFSQISNSQGVVSSASKLGTGANFYSVKNNSNLEFKGLKTDNTLIVSELDTDINLSVNINGISHNSLDGCNLGDPHTQYTLLAGRTGGQVIRGGMANDDVLTLASPGGINILNNTTSTGLIIPGIITAINDIVINEGRTNNHFVIKGTADDNLLYVSNNSIGIGTDNPEQKLHVVGNATISGDITCDNLNTSTIATSVINCSNRLAINAGGEITVSNNPVSSYGIATKGYVDDLLSGANYIYASSEPYTTSSTTTFVKKVTLITGNLVSGSYRLGWNYSWSYSNNTRASTISIVFDNNVTINETTDTAPFGDLSHKKQTCGFATIDITEGSHTFDLLFKTSNKKDIITIGQARIELWRIHWA